MTEALTSPSFSDRDVKTETLNIVTRSAQWTHPATRGALPARRSGDSVDRYTGNDHFQSSAYEFFLDTADLDELRKGARWGIVDGVTTNPSLIAKAGRPIHEQIAEICKIVDGPVSAEVVQTEAQAMIREGRDLAKIHKNVIVKCPLTRDGIEACSALSGEGIRVNITLCFSPAQALLAAKAGAYFGARL